MQKEEIVAKSPVRVLEKSIEGGLGTGNIGVIASRKGVGKTSVLVQIAIDKLLQGQKVIHVSFSPNTTHVFDWYENIFGEVARKRGLEHSAEVRDEVIHNRVVMNFSQAGVTVAQVLSSMRHLLVEGGFKASTVVIDGFSFPQATTEAFASFRAFAAEMSVEIWFTATIPVDAPALVKGKPPAILAPHLGAIAVLVILEPKGDFIHFDVVKHHDKDDLEDLKIKLDPKTLLIADV